MPSAGRHSLLALAAKTAAVEAEAMVPCRLREGAGTHLPTLVGVPGHRLRGQVTDHVVEEQPQEHRQLDLEVLLQVIKSYLMSDMK